MNLHLEIKGMLVALRELDTSLVLKHGLPVDQGKLAKELLQAGSRLDQSWWLLQSCVK